MSAESGAVELAAAVVDELERRAEQRYEEARQAAAARAAAAPCSGCADDPSRVSVPPFVLGGLIGLALYALLMFSTTKESEK